MKTRKYGVFAVLAAVTLLITAVLVTTCMGPVNPEGLSSPQGGSTGPIHIPEGRALVRLSLDATNARTVFPGFAGTWVYRIELVADDDDDNDQFLNVDDEGPHNFVLVAGESYEIIVYGYVSTAERTAERPSIQGRDTTSLANVSTGTLPGITINLKEVADEGVGFFTYDLTIPTGASATLIITPIVGGNASAPDFPYDNITLDAGPNVYTADPIELDSGFYRMAVTISQGGRQGVSFRQVVHIYQSMTSHYGPHIFPNLSRNEWNVTYHNSAGAALTAAPYTDAAYAVIAHGGTIPNAPAGPEHVTDSMLPFEHWSKVADNLDPTNEYNFGGNDPVYRDLPLYAVYTPASNVSITIEYEPINTTGFGTITIAPLSFTLAELRSTNQTITITVPNHANYTDLTWKYTQSTDTGNFDIADGTAEITLASNIYWLMGNHYFEIDGNRIDNDGRPEQVIIFYTLTN